MLTDDEIKALLEGTEGVTPGPWEIGEKKHDYAFTDYEKKHRTGQHVERWIITGWEDGQLKGKFSVVGGSVGIGIDGGQPVHMVQIRPNDAAHIARCDPSTIAELCTRLLSAEARVKVLEDAASALIADVKRRHPGEELRCQFMRALDAALQEQSK
jgi:hypothetical protein